jgi:hypothetical protein
MNPMVATLTQDLILTQDISALTIYLDRRRKANGMCPIVGCANPRPKTLAALLHRYPFLYKRQYAKNQNAKNQNAKNQNPEAIKQVEQVEELRQRMQKRFEIRLSLYVIEQMRRSKFGPIETEPTPTSTADRTDNRTDSPHNPTLISYVGIIAGLQRFTSKVWATESHKDLAQRFLRQTRHNTFGTFKYNLYIYLMASIPKRYSSSHFPDQLWHCLENLMPERRDQPIDRFLLTATCRKLFQFLTVESAKNLDHYILIDLVSNIDPLHVVELLLRILLLCPHSHVHLDKRMRILFEHYADRDQTDVRWLIQLLEYLNLAHSTNFGSVILPVKDCHRMSDLFSVHPSNETKD